MNVKRYLLPDFTVILNFISTCKNRGMFIKRKINTQVKITHTNMFNNTGKKYWCKYFMMWAHDYLVLLIKSIRHRTTGSIILHSQKIINICHIYRYIFIHSYHFLLSSRKVHQLTKLILSKDVRVLVRL